MITRNFGASKSDRVDLYIRAFQRIFIGWQNSIEYEPMAQTLNRVTLIGYLGRDPESRDIPGGQVINLSVATSETWTDRAGEKREWVEWHQVAIVNEMLGNLAAECLRKGSRVYIEGQLQTRRWTDDEGTERSQVGVVVPKYGGKLIIL